MTDLTAIEKYPGTFRLDHPNFGDVYKTVFVKGVLQAVDTDTDTCSVTVAGGSWANVPIFYHCKANMTLAANGISLHPAATAFKEDDEVEVMMQEDVPAAVLGLWDRTKDRPECKTPLFRASVTGRNYHPVYGYTLAETITYLELDGTIYWQGYFVNDLEVLDEEGYDMEESRYEYPDIYKDPHYCGLLARRICTWQIPGTSEGGYDDLSLVGDTLVITRHWSNRWYTAGPTEHWAHTMEILTAPYSYETAGDAVDTGAAATEAQPTYAGFSLDSNLSDILFGAYSNEYTVPIGPGNPNNYLETGYLRNFYPADDDPWPIPGTPDFGYM